MAEFFHNLSMQALSISNDKVILKFDAISALIRNITCLLQNRVNESIDAERQKSEDLARLINDYENAIGKTIMDDVTDSINKNEAVKLPDDFKPLTILSGEKIKKENKKEQENFIDTSQIFNSKDFKTTRNINEEEKMKIFKTIVDPNEGLLVDN